MVNNKGMMEYTNLILGFIVLMIATVSGIAVLNGLQETYYDDSTLYTTVSNESVTIKYGIASSLANTDLTTLAVKNISGTLTYTDVTDYTKNLSTGTVTFLAYPRKAINESFTSLVGVNKALANQNINITAGIVYNCSNNIAVWASGNYTILTAGTINVSAGGTMINNTAYCMNYTYSLITNNTKAYAYYSYSNGIVGQSAEYNASGNGLAGVEKVTDFATLIGIIIAISIVIGILFGAFGGMLRPSNQNTI